MSLHLCPSVKNRSLVACKLGTVSTHYKIHIAIIVYLSIYTEVLSAIFSWFILFIYIVRKKVLKLIAPENSFFIRNMWTAFGFKSVSEIAQPNDHVNNVVLF